MKKCGKNVSVKTKNLSSSGFYRFVRKRVLNGGSSIHLTFHGVVESKIFFPALYGFKQRVRARRHRLGLERLDVPRGIDFQRKDAFDILFNVDFINHMKPG